MTVCEYTERDQRGGKRGEVHGMSERSRLGLLDAMNRAVYDSVTMITLTFHENVTDKEEALRYVRAWAKRMARKGYLMSYFWKAERQKRGAIHFLLFCLDPKFTKSVAKKTWAETVNADDKALAKYGCKVEKIIKADADDMPLIAAYVAKYCAKKGKESEDEIEGRNWGKSRVQYATRIEVEITPAKLGAVIGLIGASGGTVGKVGDCSFGRVYLGRMGKDNTDCERISFMLEELQHKRKCT